MPNGSVSCSIARRLNARTAGSKAACATPELRYGQACVEDIDFSKERGLDRLVHNAHKITLKGESMRKCDAKRLDDQPAA